MIPVKVRLDLSGFLRVGDQRKETPSLLVLHASKAAASWYQEHPEHRRRPSVETAFLRMRNNDNGSPRRLNPWHFWVDADGDVSQTQTLDTITPHCGPRSANAVGVCFEDGRALTEEQHKAGALLLAVLLRLFPGSHIEKHGPHCPGPHVSVNWIRDSASELVRDVDWDMVTGSGIVIRRVW